MIQVFLDYVKAYSNEYRYVDLTSDNIYLSIFKNCRIVANLDLFKLELLIIIFVLIINYILIVIIIND